MSEQGLKPGPNTSCALWLCKVGQQWEILKIRLKNLAETPEENKNVT